MLDDGGRGHRRAWSVRGVFAFRGPVEVIIWVVALVCLVAAVASPTHGIFLTASLLLVLGLVAARARRRGT